MRKKKTVAFDLDGVILDYTKPKQHVADRYGFKLSAEQTNTNLIEKTIGDKDLYNEMRGQLYSEATFETVFFEGVLENIRKITSLCEDVLVVSARRKHHRELALKHLANLDFFTKTDLKPGSFIFSDSTDEKIKKLRQLEVFWYLDDKARVAEEVSRYSHGAIFDPLDLVQKGVIKISQRVLVCRSWNNVAEKLFQALKTA